MVKYIILIFLASSLLSKSYAQQKLENKQWKGRYLWEMPDGLQQMNLIDLLKYKDKVDKSKASKVTTTNWIIGKLRLYLKEQYRDISERQGNTVADAFKTYYDVTEIKITKKDISVKDDYLIINIEKTEIYNNGKPTVKSENIIIPLVNLKNVQFIDYETLVFTTFDKIINENGYNTDYVSLKFETGKETDIQDRLKKAFIHLATFYYRDVSNEVF